MAKQFDLGNPLVSAGWIKQGEEIPHWAMRVLSWLYMYQSIMDNPTQEGAAWRDSVKRLMEKRTYQTLHSVYTLANKAGK